MTNQAVKDGDGSHAERKASSFRARNTRPAEPGDANATCPVKAWKLILAYDGTDFHGWQVQPGLRTVQGELSRAIFEVTGERVLPQGSGRTDTGVHAEGQAVSLDLAANIPPQRMAPALNRRLPAAIRILQAEILPGFHARTNVVEKTYEYRVFPSRGLPPNNLPERVLPPWRSRYVWDCPIALSLPAMQVAATTVVGTHDFSSFAARDPDRGTRSANGEAPRSNIRTIFTSAWEQQGDLLLYRVTGSGFLHHMVRNLVGMLVEVGAGRRAPDSFPAVLQARDRRAAGPTAPPQGLFLMDVVYREPVLPQPEVPAVEADPAPC